MSFAEIVKEVQNLNQNEVSELLHELEKIQVIRASKEAAKRWEGIETLEWGALPREKEPQNIFEEGLNQSIS